MSELFGQPEYLHVLVNPLLTHALPCAAVGLLLALAARSRSAIRLALVLVLLSAAAAWPAVHYGQGAFDRVTALADDTGGDWLAVHRHRAEHGAWVFYVTAVLALVALVVPAKWGKSLLPLAALVVILAGVACGMAAYIAFPAGKIRHREFRHEEPPAAELKAAQAEDGEH